MEKLFLYELNDGRTWFYSDWGCPEPHKLKRGVEMEFEWLELTDMRTMSINKLEVRVRRLLDNV